MGQCTPKQWPSVWIEAVGNIFGTGGGSPVSINRRGVYMVASMASRCWQHTILMGRLHLPHQKVEALVFCTPEANACLHGLVYWMYLNGMSVLEMS